jgi:hypothetical protein
MTSPRGKPAAKILQGDDPHIATVRPPFDPEAFARESDSKVRVETDPVSARPTAPPPPGIPQYAPGLSSGTMHSLGSVTSDAIPTLAVARDDLEWFELPAFTRDLLHLVDGHEPIAAICLRGGIALDRAMAAFHELVNDGVITLRR